MSEEKYKFFKECEICKTNASCLCFQCNNYYCESCYKFVHDKQANSSHKKESIDPFMPIDIKCPDHPQDRMYLFCVDEKGIYFYLILY